MLTVLQVRAIEYARRSEGKPSRTVLTVLECSRVATRRSTRMELSKCMYRRHEIASGNGLLNFKFISILPFSWWDV